MAFHDVDLTLPLEPGSDAPAANVRKGAQSSTCGVDTPAWHHRYACVEIRLQIPLKTNTMHS